MKSLPTTGGLSQVWLDGSSIDGFAKPNSSLGRTSNFDHQILTSTINFNQQWLSADGILIPHLRQALIVSCDFKDYTMGMRTTIYGYIEEMDFWLDPVKTKIRDHNSNIISSLPKADSWPPLSFEMFAICNNDEKYPGPNFEYSGRIIHFGANLKSVELEWMDWKTKFESLLLNLYFLEAKVHFQTEYSTLETSRWKVDLLKYNVKHDNIMPMKIETVFWEYESTHDK